MRRASSTLHWFLVIGVLGLRGIIGAPNILGARSPHHALMYLVQSPPGIGFAVLGAAFLTLTGAEAMYADMGHFGPFPIRLGFYRACVCFTRPVIKRGRSICR